MIYKGDNTTGLVENENSNNIDECKEKIEKINKKLQATADELEKISALYAKSVKDGLDKGKKIKNLKIKLQN